MEVIETKERFIELRAKGWSFDKIAKETGKGSVALIIFQTFFNRIALPSKS